MVNVNVNFPCKFLMCICCLHNYYRPSRFYALRTYNECYHIYNIIFHLL